jgi:predicted HTH transcriptional regulator
MLIERIRSILKEGEGLKVEFKKCRNSINKDVYDTVCAFLNRHGGVILLGVEDNGAVTGIDAGNIEQIKKEFVKIFSNSKPVMVEEDVFQIIIPLTRQATEQATEQVTEQVTEQAERVEKILNYCKEPKTTSEIMTHLELTHREHFRSVILNPLIEKGLLFLTIPDKPNSPKQKYYSNDKKEKAK